MDVIAIGETMIQFTPGTEGLMRHANTYTSKIAGAETNTLIGLTRLGHRTGWISKLGDDEFGSQILMAVRGEGVDTCQTKINTSSRTGTFFKEIIREGEVRIYYYRENSAASKLAPEDLEESYLAQAKYLYITGITPALSSTARETIFHSIKLAKKNGLRVVFDPNLRRKLWNKAEAKETLLGIAKLSDIVIPGKGEGEFLFDTEDPVEIAESLLTLGASLVVVKIGEEGAYFAEEQNRGFVSGFKAQVVDPVGAGDSFAAGLISGLLDNHSTSKSVERACAMGAMAVMVRGDYEGLPDKKRLEHFIKQDQKEDISR